MAERRHQRWLGPAVASHERDGELRSLVTLPANPAAAFELKRQSDNMLVSLSATVAGNAVTLTFAGGPVEFGSLADGRYT